MNLGSNATSSIVFVTPKTSPGEHEHLRSLGAVSVITKPEESRTSPDWPTLCASSVRLLGVRAA